MAKVSICIPTYNNVSEVERLLQSIYEQDYTDYEVNISDDSTNDEIAQLVETILQQKRAKETLHYVHNEKPLGHIYNWNAAIRMATGEYIKIMFSDDWFTNQTSLGNFVKLLDNAPQAMLGFSGSRQVMLDEEVKHVSSEHRLRSYDRYAPDEYIDSLRQDYRNLFLSNQIGAPSAVIYRRGDKLTLFDEQSNWASDMFLYFELLRMRPVFAYTREPLVSIGVHEHQYTESFTERDQRIYNDYKYLYTKYELQGSKPCREYFTEQFLVKYHRGLKEAGELSIEKSMYLKKWLAEQKETVRCFISSRINKK